VAYWERIAPLDLRRVKFIDESAVNRARRRMYGRASPGERVIGRVPCHDGENITLLGTLGVEGLQAVMTVNGATDADVFRTYVKRVLGPTLVPGDLVVMDNLSAHKAGGCSRPWPAAGCGCSICPPTRPICRRWSCV
jgi:hypothetical protein